jgi:hypothetical protein
MEMKKLASAIAYDNLMSKQATGPQWLTNAWRNVIQPRLFNVAKPKYLMPAIGAGLGMAGMAPGAIQQFREGDTLSGLGRLGAGAVAGGGLGFLGRRGALHGSSSSLIGRSSVFDPNAAMARVLNANVMV